MPRITNTLLIRQVHEDFIRDDNTIHPEAYRPKLKGDTETGYERNVSTALKSCYSTPEELNRYVWRRRVLYEINSDHPNSRGYDCIQDGACHVGITGDMAQLAKDMETLTYLAVNSKRLHP